VVENAKKCLLYPTFPYSTSESTALGYTYVKHCTATALGKGKGRNQWKSHQFLYFDDDFFSFDFDDITDQASRRVPFITACFVC